MNDYLLDSRKKEPNVRPLSVSPKESSLEPGAPKVKSPRSPNKNANAAAIGILGVERQAKINVTFNNLCAVLFLNVIPLGIVLSTFININWFLMVDNLKYEYWVNFLFVEKSALDTQNQLLNRIDSSNDYFYFIPTFYIGGCNEGTQTQDDPSDFCSVLTPYFYSGSIGSIAIGLAIIFHVVHLWQLARITLYRKASLIKGFSPLRIAYFAVFLYMSSFLYWLFSSASLINDNSKHSLFARFGSGFYCYIGAICLMILVIIWFRKVYKQGIRRNLVNSLLNAEKKYHEDLPSSIYYGEESSHGN